MLKSDKFRICQNEIVLRRHRYTYINRGFLKYSAKDHKGKVLWLEEGQPKLDHQIFVHVLEIVCSLEYKSICCFWEAFVSEIIIASR